MKCVICTLQIDKVGDWTKGHNAEPVKTGRCCSRCNDMKVIPMRLAIWNHQVQSWELAKKVRA
jgi:transcriptional regulator NrdR family protein